MLALFAGVVLRFGKACAVFTSRTVNFFQSSNVYQVGQSICMIKNVGYGKSLRDSDVIPKILCWRRLRRVRRRSIGRLNVTFNKCWSLIMLVLVERFDFSKRPHDILGIS